MDRRTPHPRRAVRAVSRFALPAFGDRIAMYGIGGRGYLVRRVGSVDGGDPSPYTARHACLAGNHIGAANRISLARRYAVPTRPACAIVELGAGSGGTTRACSLPCLRAQRFWRPRAPKRRPLTCNLLVACTARRGQTDEGDRRGPSLQGRSGTRHAAAFWIACGSRAAGWNSAADETVFAATDDRPLRERYRR